MSISPQMRQLFMEILVRERPYFMDANGVIDKDGLVASALDSLNRGYPQHAEAFRREAAHTAARSLMNEHLRFHQAAFIRIGISSAEYRRRARQFVQIPLEGHQFVSKLMTHLTKAEVSRMHDYHRSRAGSHDREAVWFDTVRQMMDAAGLDDSALVGEVLREVEDVVAV